MATLQEAIESGRPFKRPEWDYWYVLNEKRIGLVASLSDESKGRTTYTITVNQAIATDWEIKPKEPRKWTIDNTETWMQEEGMVICIPSSIPRDLKVKVTIEEIIE